MSNEENEILPLLNDSELLSLPVYFRTIDVISLDSFDPKSFLVVDNIEVNGGCFVPKLNYKTISRVLKFK